MAEQNEKGHFVGSGNPNGRPKGARSKNKAVSIAQLSHEVSKGSLAALRRLDTAINKIPAEDYAAVIAAALDRINLAVTLEKVIISRINKEAKGKGVTEPLANTPTAPCIPIKKKA